MWTTAKRLMSITGTVLGLNPGQPPQALPGVAMDVFHYWWDKFNQVQFLQLNKLPAITDASGAFSFNNLEVTVQVQTVIPGSPPYLPVEIVQPDSLPCLVLHASAGTQFVPLLDERVLVDATWEAAHPERQHVALSGSAPITVEVPDYEADPVPHDQFHFLRVGRAIRDEIGELGEARPLYVDYVGKPGYLISSNARSVNVQPSFFPGQVDAPFGGTLQIGGQFGADFFAWLPDDLYYSVSFWTYSGDLALEFVEAGLTGETLIQDPLFNKRYILPTPANPNGQWETLPLGPFNGTIAGGVGSIPVYKRPPLPNLITEYWPFWDLMVIWNSNEAANKLVILTLQPYRRTGGTSENPVLQALPVSLSGNGHVPLCIDNRPPVPTYLPYNPLDPSGRKFHTALAHFIGVAESVGPSTPMGVCNEMTVQTNTPADGNECILVRYSVEDGAGNPHPHVAKYDLWAEYTPKAVLGAPDSVGLALEPSFAGFKPITGAYAPTVPPTMEVDNYQSVIVPKDANGWPPEPNGDMISPPQCPQYALEVSMGCSVRTVDGWSGLFGYPHVSRHIIVKLG